MTRGRPRQFDSDTVLQQAMLVFWRNGYRGTSMDDLTEALQINKPSIYAAFGDKEQLFLKVVDYYRERMILPATAKLLEAESLEEGLTAFFKALLNVVTGSETPPGCLIACLLTEDCCESETIKAKLADSIDAGDRFFQKVFQKHQKELNPRLTPEAAARLLVSTIHGLSIRARSGAGKKSLMNVAAAFTTIVVK